MYIHIYTHTGPDDNAEQALLSTATHATDESHYMSAIQRGFPVLPEKRYALTQFSVQSVRARTRAGTC